MAVRVKYYAFVYFSKSQWKTPIFPNVFLKYLLCENKTIIWSSRFRYCANNKLSPVFVICFFLSLFLKDVSHETISLIKMSFLYYLAYTLNWRWERANRSGKENTNMIIQILTEILGPNWKWVISLPIVFKKRALESWYILIYTISK